MAASRKREAAASFCGSRCPAEQVTKRKRSVERLACASSQPVAVETSSTEPCGISEEPAANVEAQCDRPVFLLDLFCGTAGVAAAFKSCGGEALGIDHMIDKRRVKGPVSKVDLSSRPGQRTVLEWLEADKVDAVMLAPPCGTASRAREIPIPRRHQLRKGMQPAPLRSDDEPMGLAHLQGVAKDQGADCQPPLFIHEEGHKCVHQKGYSFHL